MGAQNADRKVIIELDSLVSREFPGQVSKAHTRDFYGPAVHVIAFPNRRIACSQSMENRRVHQLYLRRIQGKSTHQAT
jgi:hypothetical protein